MNENQKERKASKLKDHLNLLKDDDLYENKYYDEIDNKYINFNESKDVLKSISRVLMAKTNDNRILINNIIQQFLI